MRHGVDRSRIIVAPGMGFDKTLEHNLAIFRGIRAFTLHQCPVLIAYLRKPFWGNSWALWLRNGLGQALLFPLLRRKTEQVLFRCIRLALRSRQYGCCKR
ncbi:MAG: dihydropteroate synthase [Desulfobulbus sp.]